MKYRTLLLAFILLVAIFFRFFHLSSNPPSLTWDEAAWGYNAYSLGIDGRDEFGRFLPYDYLESFGDYKPPMYAYLDIVPVKLFGLNEFATRFPSAFFGVLTVFITYFLVKRIFPKSNLTFDIPIIAAAILAVSPWHILLSRAAFEANVATFLLATGVWLFFAGVQEKKWCLPLAPIPFALSFYTFNSARIVAPLLVIVLAVSFYKVLWKYKTYTITAAVIGLLLILPITKFLLSPQAKLRFQEVNIFSDVTLVQTANQEVINDHNSTLSKIIHNHRIVYTLAFLQHYFDNLSPNFLFVHGDGNPKFSSQEVGELYLWDLPFFIAGALLLFKRREGYWWIIPLWLLIAIIPAATARETPHALRIEGALPMFQILVAIGVVNIISNFQFQISNFKWISKRNFAMLVFILLAINVLYFAHEYFVNYPVEFSGEWQYGYKESIAYVERVKQQYDHVYIIDALGRPYIYYLFYTKMDPREYRKSAQVVHDQQGFTNIIGYGLYTFAQDVTKNSDPNALYITIPKAIPQGAHVLKTFTLLNGKPVLVAYRL